MGKKNREERQQRYMKQHNLMGQVDLSPAGFLFLDLVLRQHVHEHNRSTLHVNTCLDLNGNFLPVSSGQVANLACKFESLAGILRERHRLEAPDGAEKGDYCG